MVISLTTPITTLTTSTIKKDTTTSSLSTIADTKQTITTSAAKLTPSSITTTNTSQLITNGICSISFFFFFLKPQTLADKSSPIADDVLFVPLVVGGSAYFCLTLIGIAVLVYRSMRKKCKFFMLPFSCY